MKTGCVRAVRRRGELALADPGRVKAGQITRVPVRSHLSGRDLAGPAPTVPKGRRGAAPPDELGSRLRGRQEKAAFGSRGLILKRVPVRVSGRDVALTIDQALAKAVRSSLEVIAQGRVAGQVAVEASAHVAKPDRADLNTADRSMEAAGEASAKAARGARGANRFPHTSF